MKCPAELYAAPRKSRSAVQPHCGHPGPTKNWCSNLSGVLTVEHPVPKMDSV